MGTQANPNSPGPPTISTATSPSSTAGTTQVGWTR